MNLTSILLLKGFINNDTFWTKRRIEGGLLSVQTAYDPVFYISADFCDAPAADTRSVFYQHHLASDKRNGQFLQSGIRIRRQSGNTTVPDDLCDLQRDFLSRNRYYRTV